jgi:hypothetical protein
LAELVGDGIKGRGVGGRGRVGGEVAGECLVLAAQAVQACVEAGQALGESCGVEIAVLEGVLVAIDRAFRASYLLGKRCALFGERLAVGLIARGGLRDGVADEAAVSVEAGELVEDRGL